MTIDSICTAPGNHLLFVGYPDNNVTIVPTFQAGILDIGGPFCDDTILAGHLSEDLVIRKDTRITGDLTIDSGVSLIVLRGVVMDADGNSDSEHGGLDTNRVEIIVHGELVIDDAVGTRPRFGSITGVAASWYGIRIMPGGRIQSGIGAQIEDAVVGVTIDALAAADTLQGFKISNCSLTGIRTASSAVTIQSDTIVGITPGKGIYIDHADPLVTQCLIDSCEYGVYTTASSSRIRETVVDGPGTYGIYVANGALYEETDSLRLVRDTVSGYYTGAHLSVNWIQHCWVDSCGFIANPTGQRSPYGIKAATRSNVWMRRSKIVNFTTTGFDSQNSYSNLGRLKVENNNVLDNGNNWIEADSVGCAPCNPRRIVHTGSTLHAHWNWWGASPPLASWFSGSVHYDSWHTGPPGFKIAPPAEDPEYPEVAAAPASFSLGQNYPNPFNAGTVIEFSVPSAQKVEIKIYNILGQTVRTLANREYTAGTHRVAWNGRNDEGDPLASGVYLYRVVAETLAQTKKMLLLK
jgi:hypothetical protein